MAQTQSVERNTHSADNSADNSAWLAAAASRKYRIHEGRVWSGGAGMVFSVPAIPGFGSLPESVRPGVAQAWLQYVTNRVGQVAEGDVQAAIDKATTEGTIPSANTNDAFERHYINTVGDKVLALRPLPEKPSDAQKKEHEAIVVATAEKHRAGKFMDFVGEGIAKSRNKSGSGKAKRVAKAADTSSALDL